MESMENYSRTPLPWIPNSMETLQWGVYGCTCLAGGSIECLLDAIEMAGRSSESPLPPSYGLEMVIDTDGNDIQNCG